MVKETIMQFKTIIFSQGMIEKFHLIRKKQRAIILEAFGIEVVEDDKLPGNVALFINADGRLVGVYKDGDLISCKE